MKLHPLYLLLLMLAAFPTTVFGQDATPSTAGHASLNGAFQGFPFHNSSTPFFNSGLGAAGFGPFVPFGTSFGGYTPYGIDPSLHYHTYPADAFRASPPPHLNSGLPALLDLTNFPGSKPASPQTWPSRGRIRIQVPAEGSEDISYELNDFQFTAKPGFEQSFDDDRKWILTISSSDDQAAALRYTLTAGNYRFLIKNGRWDIGEVIDKRTSGRNENYAPPKKQ